MAGTTSYPGALDNFSAVSPTYLGDVDSTGRDHDKRHDDTEAAMEAVQAELGVNPSGSYATVTARLAALASTVGGSPPGSVVATAANFSGIDSTGATASTTGLTAAIAATPSGGTLIIPPGTYLIDARITVTNQSIRVVAHGAEFVVSSTSTSDGSAFRFTSTFGTTYTVTTVTEALTSDGRFGNNSENMWVTTLACASTPSGIAVGDFVKVVADDLIPDFQTGCRAGQTCRVVEISGNNVVVAGTLRDAFTTTVRLAKYNTAKVTWEGGTFRHSDSLLAGSTNYGAPLQFRWLLYPEIADVHMKATSGPAIDMRNSFSPLARNILFGWIQDKPGKYGYGINDSSELGIYQNLRGTRVRHLYTTGTVAVAAGNVDLGNFGRAYGAIVSDSWSFGGTQTSFDTHGDGDNISFINCHSIDSYSAFGLRGTRHKVIGGRVHGPHNGGCVSVSTTSSSEYSWGSFIGGGLHIDGITSIAFNVSRDNGGIESRPTVIDGVTITNRTTTQAIIRADFAAVEYGRINVAAGGTRTTATNGGTVTALAVY